MISIIIPTLGLLNEKNLRYQISNNHEKVHFEIIFFLQKNWDSVPEPEVERSVDGCASDAMRCQTLPEMKFQN